MPARYDPPAPPGGPDPPGGPGTREPVLPAFLDPVTGNLMNGPPAHGRRAAQGEPGGAGPGGAGPGGESGSQPGSPPGSWPARPLPVPAPPPRRPARPGYWRLAAAGAGITAIVIAALVGVNLYDRTLTAANAGAAIAPTAAATARSTRAAAAATGTARRPAASSASTTAGGGPLPAGYAWHTITAARLGSTAGFIIAVPERWQVRVQGAAAYLEPPGGGGGIEVSTTALAAAQPVAQAQREQAATIASGQYPGYRPAAIAPVTFRGRPAAAWRFTWRPGTAARTTVLTVLVTLPTSAGAQPYALRVSAPALYFPAARKVFSAALATFAPVPG